MGGGVADLRIFNREISAREVKVVSLWPILQSAGGKKPQKMTPEERSALRLYYLTVQDGHYRQLLGPGSRGRAGVEGGAAARRGHPCHAGETR